MASRAGRQSSTGCRVGLGRPGLAAIAPGLYLDALRVSALLVRMYRPQAGGAGVPPVHTRRTGGTPVPPAPACYTPMQCALKTAILHAGASGCNPHFTTFSNTDFAACSP